MSTPNLAFEASQAGEYPSQRFNARERKLLASVAAEFPYSVLAAGTFTTLGGDASESIPVSGVAASDIVQVSVKTLGTGSRSIIAATAASNAITVTLSGDPSTNHVLQYIVVRAIA